MLLPLRAGMDKLNKRRGAKLDIFAFSYSLHKCLPIVFESFDCFPPNNSHKSESMPKLFGSGWHSYHTTELNIVLLCFMVRTICFPGGDMWQIEGTFCVVLSQLT